MRFSELEYRFAKTILNRHHPHVEKEVTETIMVLDIPLGRGHEPTPSKTLQKEFSRKGWKSEKPVGKTGLQFDCYKEKVALETETTDPADIVNDLLKFHIADLSSEIDVGVLVVYDDSIKGANIPYIKHAKKLNTYSTLIRVPIWVIGLKESK